MPLGPAPRHSFWPDSPQLPNAPWGEPEDSSEVACPSAQDCPSAHAARGGKLLVARSSLILSMQICRSAAYGSAIELPVVGAPPLGFPPASSVPPALLVLPTSLLELLE